MEPGLSIINAAWRRAVVMTCVGASLCAMGVIFWQQDLRYSLPTPRPDDLEQPPIGEPCALPSQLTANVALDAQRPVLLNFYNRDCPCSRFNLEHVHALELRYGKQVQFVSVVESDGTETVDSGLDMPHVLDLDGAIAKSLGVYSTPQAVLFDTGRRIVFRGNYNTSRYCTERQTQFARQAIEALLNNAGIVREPGAEVAYGCELPCEECKHDQR